MNEKPSEFQSHHLAVKQYVRAQDAALVGGPRGLVQCQFRSY